MKILKLLVLVPPLLLAGCLAHDLNKINAKRYYDRGYEALEKGDWEGARVAFYRASVNAEMGGSPDRGKSVVVYEYGRASGVRCMFAEAETALKKSLELDEKSGGPTNYPLIELARLHFDQGQYEIAVPYFERALAKISSFEKDALGRDPIGYAEFLEEYATALSNSNRDTEAEPLRKRASDLRDRNKDTISRTDRTPYGKHCKRKWDRFIF